MAKRFLLTEVPSGRFIGLFKSFDGAHAYAQDRLKTRVKKVKERDVIEDYIDLSPKRDPVPPAEWTKHYLYRVDEVEVE